MAEPTSYSVGYSFSGWQAYNPSLPLPAQNIDAEFANIATSIGSTIDALQDIRASDGTLREGVVSRASLTADLLTGIRTPSVWVTARIYAANDTVFFGPKFYIALLDHTSGVFATDLAAGKWAELADFTPTGTVNAVNVVFSGVTSGLAAANVQAAIDEVVADMTAGDAADVPLARLPAEVTIAFCPVGAVLPFAGGTAPSGYLLCDGAAVSRTTYAGLFAVVGTTYGTGDGSTTFNVPDLKGRVIAGQDDMGGVSANRLTGQTGGVDGDTLGAAGGAETHALTLSQNAAHTHTGTTASSGLHGHPYRSSSGTEGDGTGGLMMNQGGTLSTKPAYTGTPSNAADEQIGGSGAHTHTFTTASSGSGAAHNNVQPTLVLNYIIFAGV